MNILGINAQMERNEMDLVRNWRMRILDVHPDWAHFHGLLQEQAPVRLQRLNDVVEELHRHLSLPKGWNIFDFYEVEESSSEDE